MKERPILFSAPMVRALLNGTKTQTRRVVKLPKYCEWGRDYDGQILEGDNDYPVDELRCPYGQPGDRLWVRETFQPTFGDGVERCDTNWDTGAGFDINYPATTGRIEWIDGDDNITDRCKPAIHMPRWASRITLEITDVRVERLQDISEADAKAEGSPFELGALESTILGAIARYRSGYCRLWQSINGPDSWEANPWVWVIEFRKVTP